MQKGRMGLTILTKMTKAVITPTASRRKTRKLERISHRRSAESLPNLSGSVYLGNDNLIVFVRPIMRLHRLHPSLVAGPRDHTVGKNDIYPKTSLPITIPIKISILISQISIKRPPTATSDTDIGLPIVNIFNVNTVGSHTVYILYFRLNNFYWPSKFPTADPKSVIENELKSNSEYAVKEIIRKK
jgi:hypothetical protein